MSSIILRELEKRKMRLPKNLYVVYGPVYFAGEKYFKQTYGMSKRHQLKNSEICKRENMSEYCENCRRMADDRDGWKKKAEALMAMIEKHSDYRENRHCAICQAKFRARGIMKGTEEEKGGKK